MDCFKTDFGERIPVDVTYHNGADPVSMHNYYTFLYNQAVFTLLKEVKGEGEAVLLQEVPQPEVSSSRYTGEAIVPRLIHPWQRRCGAV